MTIQDLAQLTLLALDKLPYSRVDGPTAYALSRLASGMPDDCIFFDNAGGLAVTVWFGNELVGAVIERFPHCIYAYRTDGKDTILRRPLPNLQVGYLEWFPLDAKSDVARVSLGH